MKRAVIATAAAFAVAVLLDVLVGRDLPGFYAAYGLLSCVVIVVVSKWLGRILIQRAEDYYGTGQERP